MSDKKPLRKSSGRINNSTMKSPVLSPLSSPRYNMKTLEERSLFDSSPSNGNSFSEISSFSFSRRKSNRSTLESPFIPITSSSSFSSCSTPKIIGSPVRSDSVGMSRINAHSLSFNNSFNNSLSSCNSFGNSLGNSYGNSLNISSSNSFCCGSSSNSSLNSSRNSSRNNSGNVVVNNNNSNYNSNNNVNNNQNGVVSPRRMNFVSISPFNKQSFFSISKTLPHTVSEDNLMTITLETVLKADKLYKNRIVFIDCRYPYEYNAGHIQNASNAFNLAELNKYLPIEKGMKPSNSIYIFYCEYSQERAPTLLKELMRADALSENNYYIYNDVYLLENGFKNAFLNNFPLCEGYYLNSEDEMFKTEFNKHKRMFDSCLRQPRTSSNSPCSRSSFFQINSMDKMEEEF